MEELFNGFTIEISPGAFPFSTDSVVLSGFARLPKNAKVLDLGSGCGTLGVLLCARDPHCQVTGIEIDPAAHETALKNAAANAIEDRLSSICTDLTAVSSFIAPGSFDCCISNPPILNSHLVYRHLNSEVFIKYTINHIFNIIITKWFSKLYCFIYNYNTWSICI